MKIGAKIHGVKSCSSTNDLAKELAIAQEKEGTVVISEEQTKGRGTKGRSWYSVQKKGLYLSIILRPSDLNISLLPLLAGVAVNEAIFKSVGIKVRLKWPNDLIWEKKKLGGILCESGFLGDRVNYVILGIGLNMNHEKDDFPEEIRQESTSLKLVTKEVINKKAFLGHLWSALNHWYGQFLKGEEKKIICAFQENSILSPGKEVVVETEGGEFSGIYMGINSQGGLILESRGKRKSLFPAEIMRIKDEKKEE